jgi:sugar lactone lactonase YvrE
MPAPRDPMTLTFTCIADLKCRLAESPVYDERTDRLYFVDIPEGRVHSIDAAGGGLKTWTFGTDVGSLGLAASGRLVVALRDSVVLFDPTTETRHELCRIEPDLSFTRLNDGKVGPDGAFWVGTLDERREKQPVASLYRVDGSGQVTRKIDGLLVSNGLAWTADGEIMFHSDSRGPWIDRWRFDRASGEIGDRLRIAVLDDVGGRPDGGACDVDGFYWSAGVSGGRLNRFAADGALAASYTVPVPAPTMPCFGGRDFRTLYLTSLREGRTAEVLEASPHAGCVLAAQSPVAGFPPWRFLDV